MSAIGRADMPLEVLLVDDNPGDVRLVQEAFREARDTIHLHVAVDGVEALTFLRQEGEHANSPRPDFILLDISMPRMGGREVLAFIKTEPESQNNSYRYPDCLGGRRGCRRRATPSRLTATSKTPGLG